MHLDMSKITKAVITAAGQGTRFLPATKNIPKELIPIINKPTIHYKVEACINAGIKEIIIVTRFGNSAVEDYFDTAPVLENYLRSKGKEKEAEEIKKIYTSANFIFVRQDPTLPYGTGAALYSVRNVIKDESFVFGFGDDLILTDENYIKGMIDTANEENTELVLSVQNMPRETMGKWGMVDIKEGTKDVVERFLEKPRPEEITSTLASLGNYILPSSIFDILDPKNLINGEFIFQQTFPEYIKRSAVRAYMTPGKFLTNGDPLNYLISTVEVALSRDDLKVQFKEYLKSKIKEL